MFGSQLISAQNIAVLNRADMLAMFQAEERATLLTSMLHSTQRKLSCAERTARIKYDRYVAVPATLCHTSTYSNRGSQHCDSGLTWLQHHVCQSFGVVTDTSLPCVDPHTCC